MFVLLVKLVMMEINVKFVLMAILVTHLPLTLKRLVVLVNVMVILTMLQSEIVTEQRENVLDV